MADLADGESVEMQGSGRAPYVLKNVGGVYSCSCPAWRNQSIPIERRTCKHLRKLRGDKEETERVGSELPPRKKPAASSDDGESSAGPPLLLAHSWENDLELTGWWMSEKLDGVRAYWDGARFISRLGNEFLAPDWFIAGMPKIPLDGELWIERKSFQKTVSIVRRQDKSDHWKQIQYLVFDAPACSDQFEERLKFLAATLKSAQLKHVQPHDHQLCRGVDHLQAELQRVEALGGEGLMLRQPGSMYEVGRSSTLLKVKTFHDSEATVVDHVDGKGRHKGRLGALVVQLPDGTEFSVGTGFSDRERESPPEIGAKITFRYQELSDGGVPRFPSFVRLCESTAGETVGKKTKSGSGLSTKVNAASQSDSKTKVVANSEDRSTPPAKPAGSAAAKSGKRYFEFVSGGSAKFWEIFVDGLEVTVRFGRIGTNGQLQSKSLATADQAQRHAEKLIGEKSEKGYEEKSPPGD